MQHPTPERFFLDDSPPNSTSDLSWMAYESNMPSTASPDWFAFQDDAVAPNNQLTPTSISTEQDAYQGIEHVMNDFIQQTFQVEETNSKNVNVSGNIGKELAPTTSVRVAEQVSGEVKREKVLFMKISFPNIQRSSLCFF